MHVCVRLGRRSLFVPHNTTDAAGKQRFHGMDPNWIANFVPAMARNHTVRRGYYDAAYEAWAQQHGFKWGMDIVPRQSVLFHRMKGAACMKRHHAILYRDSCPLQTPLGKALLKLSILNKELLFVNLSL
jgi:hypothetical protein